MTGAVGRFEGGNDATVIGELHFDAVRVSQREQLDGLASRRTIREVAERRGCYACLDRCAGLGSDCAPGEEERDGRGESQ